MHSPSFPPNRVTRIKICGITSVDAAKVCLDEGVDAIGLVFYDKSPRAVSLSKAHEIAASVGAFVTVTGLFVNASPEKIQQVLDSVPLHLLQFHGEETPGACAVFGRPFLKALRIGNDTDIQSVASRYNLASGLLLDTYRQGVPGGTGECFDWNLVPQSIARDIVLAGGLDSENVVQAIEQVRPYGVDVSGGVESSPGVKDAEKIRAFVRAVRCADARA